MSVYIVWFKTGCSAIAHEKKAEQLKFSVRPCNAVFKEKEKKTTQSLSQVILFFWSHATGALEEMSELGQEEVSKGGTGENPEWDAKLSLKLAELV